MSAQRAQGFTTRQLHAGVDTSIAPHSRATPIHLTAGFVFEDFEQAEARFAGSDEGFSYTRVGNPTNAALERRIAALEGGVGALVVSTGSAAIATTLLALVSDGSHIVSSSSIYEGTRELIRDDLARLGIGSDFVIDAQNLASWEAAIRPSTRALFVESIPNPKNDLVDLAAISELAHRHGIPLVVDNTLATPYLLRPIKHGADIVVHSASKFLSGHGTALGGVIVDSGRFPWAANRERYPHIAEAIGADGLTFVERAGDSAFIEFARRVALRYGPAPSPVNAFLIMQGIETLSLRVRRQSASAARIAAWLEHHPDVESVDYSGLPSHPSNTLARTYLPDGQGAVLAVTLRGGRSAAKRVTDALRIFTRMTHVGDVRSLVLHPASTTHNLRTEAELEAAGVGPGMLRLSIGVEDPEDLIADLDRALASASAASAADAAPSSLPANERAVPTQLAPRPAVNVLTMS